MVLKLTNQEWLAAICDASKGETCDHPPCTQKICSYHQFRGADPAADFAKKLHDSTILLSQTILVADLNLGAIDCSTESVAIDVFIDTATPTNSTFILSKVNAANAGQPAYYHGALFTSLLARAQSFCFYYIDEGSRKNVIFSASINGSIEYYDVSGQKPPGSITEFLLRVPQLFDKSKVEKDVTLLDQHGNAFQ